MFVDRAKISVKSGRGGDGHVSFRREKYVPNGGPDGGDGGKGGNVIFTIDEGQNTLSSFRYTKAYKAESGANGSAKKCSGKSGADLVIKVPSGTIIREEQSNKIIIDMSGENRTFTMLRGGRGGKGNQHYATSTMQAPKYAQPGQAAQELDLLLELKVIADVGLLGFPNVGKSTLLTRISKARPKVANYHFTTLIPYLGVVDLDDSKGFVVADIPGLIEGASEGMGLGFTFLRHVERTKVLIHVIDAAGSEGRCPLEDIIKINNELLAYSPELATRPQVIAANKMDIIGPTEDDGEAEILSILKAHFEPQGISVYPISAVSGEGIRELLYHVRRMLDDIKDEPTVFSPEYIVDELSSFTNEPYTVIYDEAAREYVVEGARIEKMLGYTNLEAEKGFLFFQRFLKEAGVLQELIDLGIEEGATVRMYGNTFEYYE
ncbi:MAG: GTPase ObgE [Lachnospiraceae bacterium]|jgi:GTP-binding protein|nr:GTPase ObgE [Lachnospiraceae bacterium]